MKTLERGRRKEKSFSSTNSNSLEQVVDEAGAKLLERVVAVEEYELENDDKVVDGNRGDISAEDGNCVHSNRLPISYYCEAVINDGSNKRKKERIIKVKITACSGGTKITSSTTRNETKKIKRKAVGNEFSEDEEGSSLSVSEIASLRAQRAALESKEKIAEVSLSKKSRKKRKIIDGDESGDDNDILVKEFSSSEHSAGRPRGASEPVSAISSNNDSSPSDSSGDDDDGSDYSSSLDARPWAKKKNSSPASLSSNNRFSSKKHGKSISSDEKKKKKAKLSTSSLIASIPKKKKEQTVCDEFTQSSLTIPKKKKEKNIHDEQSCHSLTIPKKKKENKIDELNVPKKEVVIPKKVSNSVGSSVTMSSSGDVTGSSQSKSLLKSLIKQHTNNGGCETGSDKNLNEPAASAKEDFVKKEKKGSNSGITTAASPPPSALIDSKLPIKRESTTATNATNDKPEVKSLISKIAPPPKSDTHPANKSRDWRSSGCSGYSISQEQRQHQFSHQQHGIKENEYTSPTSLLSSQLPESHYPQQNMNTSSTQRGVLTTSSPSLKNTILFDKFRNELCKIMNKIVALDYIGNTNNTNQNRAGSDGGSVDNIDMNGSFIPTSNREKYDFFDTDENGTILLQPKIPIFPEDFSNYHDGQKEWPLSWWGIVKPTEKILSLHDECNAYPAPVPLPVSSVMSPPNEQEWSGGVSNGWWGGSKPQNGQFQRESKNCGGGWVGGQQHQRETVGGSGAGGGWGTQAKRDRGFEPSGKRSDISKPYNSNRNNDGNTSNKYQDKSQHVIGYGGGGNEKQQEKSLNTDDNS